MPHCPECHSTSLRRSPTRTRWERWRKEVTGKRPYRCLACHWRGWKRIGIVEEGLHSAHAQAVAPDPPNLKGTSLARRDAQPQLDLKELDRFLALTKDDA